MSYKLTLERLKSLPPEKQILAAFTYKFFNDEGKPDCGCAIGKIAPKFYTKLTKDDDVNWIGIDNLASGGIESWKEAWDLLSSDLKELNLTEGEAENLQEANDRLLGKSNDLEIRQARYKAIVDWLENRVALENNSSQANTPV